MIRSASPGPGDSAVSRPRGRARRGDVADLSLTIATVGRQQQQQQQQQHGGGQQEEEDLLRGSQPLPRHPRGCGDRARGGGLVLIPTLTFLLLFSKYFLTIYSQGTVRRKKSSGRPVEADSVTKTRRPSWARLRAGPETEVTLTSAK